MMFRVGMIAALLATCATTAPAQVTCPAGKTTLTKNLATCLAAERARGDTLTAQIARLTAQIAQLRAEVGPIPDLLRDGLLDTTVVSGFASDRGVSLPPPGSVDATTQAIVDGLAALYVRVSGKPMVHIGHNDAVLSELMSGRDIWLSIAGDEAMLGGGTAGIILTSDNPKVGHAIYANGGDRSLRILYNTRPTVGQTSDATLAQTRMDFEQDGVISMGYTKPANSSTGPYDDLKGKAILFRPGGDVGSGSQRGYWVEFGGGHVGRGFRIGVVDAGGVPNVPTYKIQMDADGSANPLSLWIDGGLRRLRACNFGGQSVVCF